MSKADDELRYMVAELCEQDGHQWWELRTHDHARNPETAIERWCNDSSYSPEVWKRLEAEGVVRIARVRITEEPEVGQ